jgi:hypothetical protein
LPVLKRRKHQEVTTKGRVKTGRWNCWKTGTRLEWRQTVLNTASRWRGRDLGEVGQAGVLVIPEGWLGEVYCSSSGQEGRVGPHTCGEGEGEGGVNK